MRDNESHIIDEILNGRTFRYEYFVETYSRQVFATIVRIIDKPEDAEELTQDVFMKAFKNLSSFNGKSTFATWLYRIAYNTAISAARRSVPVESLIDDRQLTLISDNAVDEALDDDSEEQIEKLNDAIARLSADERALVNMFYMEEQSVSDIAYITGLSVPNAKTKLHRVRKKLYLLMTETKKL